MVLAAIGFMFAHLIIAADVVSSAMLHPRKSKSKAKAPAADGRAGAGADAEDGGAPADALPPDDPTVFRLPLVKPLCDNTTKFFKFSRSDYPTSSAKSGSVPGILRVLHGRRSCIASFSGINRRITGFISYLSLQLEGRRLLSVMYCSAR